MTASTPQKGLRAPLHGPGLAILRGLVAAGFMALGFMALGFAAARAETPAQPSSRDVHALLDAYKCSICHDERDPRAGPSYAEIAHAYRGRQGGFGHLLSVIKQGEHGGGPWHMPPHPEVSDAEARAMARYILSVPD